jgi:hypothetical protein
MCNLFKQLGLPCEPEQVDDFIAQHRALSDGIPIEQAPFWNDSQSLFLRSAIDEDSQWCEAVDQLDARLRY